MTETAVAPATSQGFSIEVPREDTSARKYIFTVADRIAPLTKASVPEYAFGGVIDPANGLKRRNGYVRRCEITELEQFMDSEAAAFVEPGQRRHFPGVYDVTIPGEGKRRIGLFKDGPRAGEHDGLLRMPFYPTWECDVLTSRIDGMVDMPVKNDDEKERAQRFLFPNWDEIEFNPEGLPVQTAKLRNHFFKRLSAAQGDTFLTAVCLAAIKSCDQFRTWGTTELAAATALYKRAEKEGWAWSLGADAALACEQLGLARPDLLTEQQNSKFDALADSMQKLVELQVQNAQAAAAPPPPAPAPPPAPPATTQREQTPPETTTGDVNDPPKTGTEDVPKPKCLATTNSGAQCKNDAEADGFCKMESHNAEAEAAKQEAAEKAAAEDAAQAAREDDRKNQ